MNHTKKQTLKNFHQKPKEQSQPINVPQPPVQQPPTIVITPATPTPR